jgi:hypothetical protein
LLGESRIGVPQRVYRKAVSVCIDCEDVSGSLEGIREAEPSPYHQTNSTLFRAGEKPLGIKFEDGQIVATLILHIAGEKLG